MRCTRPPRGAAARAAARHSAQVPVIETARLILRAPRLADLPLWTAIYAEAATGLGGPYSAEAAWEEFSYYTACWMLHGHGLWTIERRADGATIGFVHVGLEWDDAEPELGWLLAPEARSQGYAAEAARAARDHGVALLGTLVSYVDPGYAPSGRVAAALGATRDSRAEAALGGDIHVWRHSPAASSGAPA